MGDGDTSFRFVIDADGRARVVNLEPEHANDQQHRPRGGNRKRRHSNEYPPPATLEELIQSTRPTCSEKDQNKLPTLKIINKTGDLFTNALNTVLVHACNCQGEWGAGIASAFKDKFPKAFDAYAEHCKANSPDQLAGTALLIAPPEDSIYTNENSDIISPPWIGCLFTSTNHGKKKDGELTILSNTIAATKDLLRAILRKDYYKHSTILPKPHERYVGTSSNHHPKLRSVDILAIRMCQINSGLFKVPWAKTKLVLERIEVGTGEFMEIEVVIPLEGGKGKKQSKVAGVAKAANAAKAPKPKPKSIPGPSKRKKKRKDQAAE